MVDNTGVHCVARCLKQHAKGEIDLLGLLQFATQVVFCNSIVVGHFESDEVRHTTDSVLLALIGLGCEPESLDRKRLDRRECADLCHIAGDLFADDFDYLFPREQAELLATVPDFGMTGDADASLHKLISSTHSQIELSERVERALDNYGAGVVEYAVMSSAKLFSALRAAWVRMHGWPLEVTAQFGVVFRMRMNDLLAHKHDAFYSPSVGRAKLIRQTRLAIEQRLSEVVSGAVVALTHRPLYIPSVGLALIRGANGDPHAVLAEAVRFRKKAAPLRKRLTSVVHNLEKNDIETFSALEEELRSLSRALNAELHLGAGPDLWNALDLQLEWLPNPSINVGMLVKWLEQRCKRRYIQVLTDLSKALAFSSDLDLQYRYLLTNITSQR